MSKIIYYHVVCIYVILNRIFIFVPCAHNNFAIAIRFVVCLSSFWHGRAGTLSICYIRQIHGTVWNCAQNEGERDRERQRATELGKRVIVREMRALHNVSTICIAHRRHDPQLQWKTDTKKARNETTRRIIDILNAKIRCVNIVYGVCGVYEEVCVCVCCVIRSLALAHFLISSRYIWLLCVLGFYNIVLTLCIYIYTFGIIPCHSV